MYGLYHYKNYGSSLGDGERERERDRERARNHDHRRTARRRIESPTRCAPRSGPARRTCRR